MEMNIALKQFAALSQETRLQAFRLLVKAGPQGMAAGVLSQALEIPHNTLSFHLSHLNQAQLVLAERQGRSIIYRANYPQIQALIRFMVEDCCSNDYARLQEGQQGREAVVELITPCPCGPNE